jgi:hypothetical protein
MPSASKRRGSHNARLPDRPLIQRYRGRLLGAVAVIVVVAGIVIAVLQAATGGSGRATAAAPADPALVQAVTAIPQSTLDAVGTAASAIR